MLLFLFFNTHTYTAYYVRQLYTTALLCFPYTLEGFEPEPSVPEADTISTASRRQGSKLGLFKRL
jgi:hypothetical protein